MSISDRSRSPASRPSFGPYIFSSRTFQNLLAGMVQWAQLSEPYLHPPRTQIIPKWPGTPSRTYGLFRPQMTPQPLVPSSWTNAHPFPPSPPLTLPPPSIPPTQASICAPTQPCLSTPNVHISSSQTTSRSPPRPLPRSNTPSHSSTETRVYGFDLNEHWQADKEHHDNQKIPGLNFPHTIRSSAFTQKLDVEGCDPLALPLAALLYRQANNHWLRNLAHGREMYLIPTGDIAAAQWWSS